MKTKILPLAVACFFCATFVFAFEKNKTAYTKRFETALLEEPKPLAKSVATLPVGSEVKIVELDTRWAKVSSGKDSGWIYLGNLAEEKPAKDHSIEGLPTTASETTASIAARPLDRVAKEYANGKGLGEAAADITWLEGQTDSITIPAIIEYLKAQKKGEFQ